MFPHRSTVLFYYTDQMKRCQVYGNCLLLEVQYFWPFEFMDIGGYEVKKLDGRCDCAYNYYIKH